MISQDVFPEIAVELRRLTNPLLVGLLRILTRFYLRRADRIVAIGETMKRRLEAKGADADRIRVIPNWTDTHALSPQPRDNVWAQEQDLVGRFVVMHSGNVGHAQDLETLARALTFLRDLDDLRCVVIGTGARHAELVALAERLEVEIVFLPYQPSERLAESLSAADVHVVGLGRGLSGFVVPSRMYGILAVGRPVIVVADAESETARIAGEIDCGVVVPPARPELLAQAIRAAHDGELDLGGMGSQGPGLCRGGSRPQRRDRALPRAPARARSARRRWRLEPGRSLPRCSRRSPPSPSGTRCTTHPASATTPSITSTTPRAFGRARACPTGSVSTTRRPASTRSPPARSSSARGSGSTSRSGSAQLLNAVLALGSALLLLALARELWPGRRILHALALGFFVCSAVLLKAAAMFHPETLDLFLSTLALLLAARMIVRDDYRVLLALALGVVLGAGQLVRAFSLWTFAVVLLALAAAAFADPDRRRRIVVAGAVAVAATAAVAGPWYAYQARSYTNPIFDRPQVAKPLWERRPAEFYVDPGVPEVVTRPYRPSFENRFWPTLYAEGWGDWFGAFAWQVGKGEPAPKVRRELVAQSVVGLVPTALAVVGWLWLLVSSLRRPRASPERLLIGLLPLAGIAGMLYFTVSYPTEDGDVIKATYMLTTLPAWALGFGFTAERLVRRRFGLVLALLLGVAALSAFASRSTAVRSAVSCDRDRGRAPPVSRRAWIISLAALVGSGSRSRSSRSLRPDTTCRACRRTSTSR